MTFISDEHLTEMRLVCDLKADQVIADYFPAQKPELQSILDELSTNSVALPSTATESLQILFKDIQSKYPKYDPEELREGQEFFAQYAQDMLFLLGFLSLPYCYAAANGAQVLASSKRILEDPATRLSETAQFVFDVLNPKAFEQHGSGMVSILKVRLMHAATRWYLQNKGKWDAESYGKPINQEDMAGTNLAFSLIAVRGLRKLGKQINAKQAWSYLVYWNMVGEMLGVDESLVPRDNKEAFHLEKAIRKRQFAQSEAGLLLMKSLKKYFVQETEGTMVEGMVDPFMVYLIGEQVSRLLGFDLSYEQRVLFKPLNVFMKMQSLLVNQKSTFGEAYSEFKKRSADHVKGPAFRLP